MIFQVFIYLQLLDFITTMIGFRVGAGEASPFLAKLIHLTTPAIGVGLAKVLGVGFGGFCLTTGRTRLVHLINYWYAGLVIWNLCVILMAGMRAQMIAH